MTVSLSQLRWQDAVDVILLTLVLWRIYLWLRGTVALQVAVGMLTLVAASYAASELGLLLTAYLLQGVSAVSVLVTVVIFREEIRRALTRASPLRLLLPRRAPPPDEQRELTPVAETLFTLARKRIGALVVFRRRDPVREQATGGVGLDALLSGPLVEALFQKDSPLHDGALVVSGRRVAKAGAFLPLAQGELPVGAGTRHSAAVGLSEVTDALVVVVSEERGTVSLAEDGALSLVADATVLAHDLAERLGPRPAVSGARRRLVRDALVGAGIFVCVVASWNIVANGRDAEEERKVPVELRGVPAGARLEAVPVEVTLRLRCPRRLLAAPGPGELHAWADVTKGAADAAVAGVAPPGVEIVAVRPPRVSLLERRTLRVEPQLSGRARVVRVEPSEVTLVGKVGAWKGAESVKTRPIEASGRAEVVVPAGLYLADEAAGTVTVTLDAK